LKKIILIGPAYPLRGGIAAFTERLAAELILQQNEVRIESYSLQYPKWLFPGKTQFTTEKNKKQLPVKTTLNSINPLSWVKLGKRLRNEKADVVVFTYWIPFMAPALGTIARILGKNKYTKRLALAHNILPHEKRPGDKMLTRYFVKSMDGFLVLSDSVKADLQLFGIEKPIAQTPHPLYDNFGKCIPRPEALNTLALDPTWNYLLFFGFIREYKGLDLAIKALASQKLKGLKIKLIVAGEFYKDEAYYRSLVQELGLADRVLFYDHFIPDSTVPVYFSAADLVVQPYKSATQSGVTQIAYHFEKPILVTNVGGLPELVPHLRAGYVCKQDAEEIAESISDFFVQKREKAFIASIQEIKKNYSWDLFVKQFTLLLEQTKIGR